MSQCQICWKSLFELKSRRHVWASLCSTCFYLGLMNLIPYKRQISMGYNTCYQKLKPLQLKPKVKHQLLCEHRINYCHENLTSGYLFGFLVPSISIKCRRSSLNSYLNFLVVIFALSFLSCCCYRLGWTSNDQSTCFAMMFNLRWSLA